MRLPSCIELSIGNVMFSVFLILIFICGFRALLQIAFVVINTAYIYYEKINTYNLLKNNYLVKTFETK